MLPSILIDATHYRANEATGVENYVQELLPALSRLLERAGIAVSWIGHLPNPPEGMPAGVKWVHSSHHRFWGQRALNKELNKLQPTLFFTPSGVPPVLYKGKTAVTVHDLAVYSFPRAFTTAQRFRLKPLLRQAATRASLIFTPSQFTKQEVERIWQIPAEKIKVTPLSFHQTAVKAEPLAAIKTDAPIILFIGRIEWKKNLLPLINGFARLVEQRPAQLILAGKDGFGAASIHSVVSALPPAIKQRIHFPGYIADAKKAWLYQKAALVVVPGTVEGSSLPLLEAFAYKVPTLCSAAGPLPELAGAASLYAQADSADDWYRKLDTGLTDRAWAERAGREGQKRLRLYSWEKTAKLTADGIETILKPT